MDFSYCDPNCGLNCLKVCDINCYFLIINIICYSNRDQHPFYLVCNNGDPVLVFNDACLMLHFVIL